MVQTIFMHPFYGGEAVYMARAILRLDVIDELPPMRRAHQQTQIAPHITVINKKGTLFPNPAKSEVTFRHPLVNVTDYLELRIKNIFGGEIVKYHFNKNEFSFSISELSQGIYFAEVFINGVKSEIHQLTIIK